MVFRSTLVMSGAHTRRTIIKIVTRSRMGKFLPSVGEAHSDAINETLTEAEVMEAVNFHCAQCYI